MGSVSLSDFNWSEIRGKLREAARRCRPCGRVAMHALLQLLPEDCGGSRPTEKLFFDGTSSWPVLALLCRQSLFTWPDFAGARRTTSSPSVSTTPGRYFALCGANGQRRDGDVWRSTSNGRPTRGSGKQRAYEHDGPSTVNAGSHALDVDNVPGAGNCRGRSTSDWAIVRLENSNYVEATRFLPLSCAWYCSRPAEP